MTDDSLSRSVTRLEFLVRHIERGEDNRPQYLRALPDAYEPYYRLLYELGKAGKQNILEIGTYRGTSAAHLAAGQGNLVTTVNINPDAARCVRELNLLGIASITSDSGEYGKRLHAGMVAPEYDILFIDGLHNFNQTYGEYELFRPFVKPGGIILIDDVDLGMDGDEMNVFWEYVIDPKFRCDTMHATGFGICVKDPASTVPSWKSVIAPATEKIRARQVRRG